MDFCKKLIESVWFDLEKVLNHRIYVLCLQSTYDDFVHASVKSTLHLSWASIASERKNEVTCWEFPCCFEFANLSNSCEAVPGQGWATDVKKRSVIYITGISQSICHQKKSAHFFSYSHRTYKNRVKGSLWVGVRISERFYLLKSLKAVRSDRRNTSNFPQLAATKLLTSRALNQPKITTSRQSIFKQSTLRLSNLVEQSYLIYKIILRYENARSGIREILRAWRVETNCIGCEGP